ncbi:MAG TPA: hypothetical protein VM097_13550 [Mycobacteriales bacterium]|nr:hypothetical protein [Mycobacteriales bacterium]
MNPLVLLAALLVIPGLILLALLMEWLEQTFAQRVAADDIARLLADELEIEQLEASVALAAEPLFFSPRSG